MNLKYEDAENVILLKNDEILFREGDPGGQLFLILSGNIRIFRHTKGSEVKLSDMKEGEVIGTMSLLDNSTRTASAKSVEVSKVKYFSTSNLTNMIDTEVPKWYQTILKDIISRFKTVEQNYLKLRVELDKAKEEK